MTLTPLYKSGDYCCVTITGRGFQNTVCDDAIHFFTKSPYAHAFMITDASIGEIVEATPGKGVAYANISKYAPYEKVFSSSILSDVQRGKIINCARNQVGRYSYGFKDIVYLGMYTQGVRWNWLESEVLEENRQTICSQSVALCGVAGNETSWLCNQPHPNLVWPGSLAKLALGKTLPPSQTLGKRHVRGVDRLTPA
jgi:hypothetical protein